MSAVGCGLNITVNSRLLIGNNSQKCINGEEPCSTVDYALNHTSHCNDTIVSIAEGVQPLDEDTLMESIINIQIIGLSSSAGGSIINCTRPKVGLSIIDVTNLLIRNVTFIGCGTLFNESNTSYHAGIHIYHSTNVTIDSVSVTDTKGIGLMILDSAGPVYIANSNFTGNKVPEDVDTIYGGSSLYIAFTRCHSLIHSFCNDDDNPYSHNNQFIITGCVFIDNNASLPSNKPVTYIERNEPVLEPFGQGGGLSIMLGGNSSYNNFTIEKCHFAENYASIGGGMSIQIKDQACDNSILLIGDKEEITFLNNGAIKGGGGIEFGFFHAASASRNNITFISVSFQFNKGLYGGGTSVYSSRLPFGVDTGQQNRITFQDCVWKDNNADIGAAVVLFPEDWSLITDGYLPTPLFIDCTIARNGISFDDNIKSLNKISEFSTGGILFSDTFSINISSTAVFHDNAGSAIHMLSGSINVLPNTVMNFTSNKCFRGAGIALLSFSTIVAHENTSIHFEANEASDVGGALYYYSTDNLDFINSRRCFIRYVNLISPYEWDMKITFKNNKAKYGSAIYAESLEPCARATNVNATELFQWNSFTFEPDVDNSSHVIATAQKTIILDDSNIQMSPGVPVPLNIEVKDDLGQTIDIVLQASCKDPAGEGGIVKQYNYVSDDYRLALKGYIGLPLNVQLQTIDSRSIGIGFNVTLDSCPPGYVMDYSNTSCICSISSDKRIRGIVSCNEPTDNENSTKHGLLMLGYWADCNEDGKLMTAQCPLGYCNYTEFRRGGLVSLPSTCDELHNSLCTMNRAGRMCGNCTDNNSVHYHSTRFKCDECNLSPPELGILLYIVSELVPLTIVFILVIRFDVSVTSGAVNSFILFAQLLDFFQVTAFGSYNTLQTSLQFLTDIYWFIFGFLNLDFFRLDDLSFCLWEGASVLDVLVFKYVTTFYGFLLIALLFILLDYCNCAPIKRLLSCSNADGHYNIVNGICTFLVITYSQVTKVSFQILTLSNVNGPGNKKVVFLSGETEFFTREHLKYAIPAIIVLVTYTLFLPLCLIGQPLYILVTKVLMQRRLLREDATCCCCNAYGRCNNWITRLGLFCKPTLDAFQSCFKANMRFYAGLFFFYRLIASLGFAFATTAIDMYFFLEIVVIVMLTTNAIFQPYQNNFYNIIDTLIFANLAVINGISLFKTMSNQFFIDENNYTVIAVIQVILIYIPLVYICLLLLIKLIAHNSHKMRYKLQSINEYVPLYDPHLLERDQQQVERDYLEEEQEDQDNDSFTPNHYPVRLFGPVSRSDTESEEGQMNRGGAKSVRGRRIMHGQSYGALHMNDRHTK